MVDVQVQGMNELLANLRIIPERIQKNVLTGGVRASAKPIIAKARSLVPKDTGTLKKSIGVTKFRPRNRNFVWFQVSPRISDSNDWWYAHLIEFGTYAKRVKPLSRATHYGGERAFKRNALIAKGFGIVPSAFMRKAYEQEGDNTISFLKNYMRERIPRELANL